MRKIIFAQILCAISLTASAAAAATVLNTTQADVKKQCDGKTKCSAACGSTLCDYVCDDPKKQCTVAIFMKGPTHSHRPTTTGAAARAAVAAP
jgi:hypothetical protein